MTEIKIINSTGLKSGDTHKLIGFEKLFRYAMNYIFTNKSINPMVIDPFSRKCMWGTKRNDINPKFFPDYTTHCMDALEFLKNENTAGADIILFDPPFSDRQSNEEYGTNNLYANPKYISNLGKEMFRILKPGGFVIKCGYNTNPPSNGFTLIAVNICNFGASINDISFSLWVKNQKTLTSIVGLS